MTLGWMVNQSHKRNNYMFPLPWQHLVRQTKKAHFPPSLVELWIGFKSLEIIFKAHSELAPGYLTKLLMPYLSGLRVWRLSVRSQPSRLHSLLKLTSSIFCNSDFSGFTVWFYVYYAFILLLTFKKMHCCIPKWTDLASVKYKHCLWFWWFWWFWISFIFFFGFKNILWL